MNAPSKWYWMCFFSSVLCNSVSLISLLISFLNRNIDVAHVIWTSPVDFVLIFSLRTASSVWSLFEWNKVECRNCFVEHWYRMWLSQHYLNSRKKVTWKMPKYCREFVFSRSSIFELFWLFFFHLLSWLFSRSTHYIYSKRWFQSFAVLRPRFF